MSNADRQQLLLEALEAVLVPLARLAVARGLPFAQAEELFKRAYVRAAREARRTTGAATSRDVSQVSVATGLSRREVTRISGDLQPMAVQRPSPATQLFTRWISSKRLRDAQGRPRPLPRSGRAPSFDSLAASVTRHVHPRSLLDELCRLGLVEVSDDGRIVTPLADRVVPRPDDERLLGFLGANVGDHLAASVSNVMHKDRRHVEQALFTDELSAESARALDELARAQWRALAASIVPELERLIAEDQALGRRTDHRARLGLYGYHEPLPENDHDEDADASDPTA